MTPILSWIKTRSNRNQSPQNALAGNLNCGRTADITKCTLRNRLAAPLGFNFVRCRGELTDRAGGSGEKNHASMKEQNPNTTTIVNRPSARQCGERLPGVSPAVFWHAAWRLALRAAGGWQSNPPRCRRSGPAVRVPPEGAPQPMRRRQRFRPEPRRRHPPPIRRRWSRRRPAVAAPPCLARRWRHACRKFAAAKEKERRL